MAEVNKAVAEGGVTDFGDFAGDGRPLSRDFSATDFASTVRWIADRYQKLDEAQQSANDFLLKKAAMSIAEEFAAVSGTEVSWQIPVSRVTPEFLEFQSIPASGLSRPCEVIATVFGRTFRWPPPGQKPPSWSGSGFGMHDQPSVPHPGRVMLSEVTGLQTIQSLASGQTVFVEGRAIVALNDKLFKVDVVVSQAIVGLERLRSLVNDRAKTKDGGQQVLVAPIGNNALETLRNLDADAVRDIPKYKPLSDEELTREINEQLQSGKLNADDIFKRAKAPGKSKGAKP